LGCRLDSWSEYLKRDVWETLVEKHKSLIDEFMNAKEPDKPLPWSCIDSGVSENFMLSELNKSRTGEITSSCINKCSNCGICPSKGKIVQNIIQNDVDTRVFQEENTKKPDPATHRILFSFSKQQSAVFQPHLSLLEIFSTAFVRANIPVLYSQGFNPLPRLDIASPLSLGIKAGGEIATIDTEGYFCAEKFKETLNNFLPEGLTIGEAMNVLIPSGGKKHSVPSLLWGYLYAGEDGSSVPIEARYEKAYRASRCVSGENFYDMERLSVLAKSSTGNPGEASGISYFEVYRKLYSEDR
jgi:hypothetical protein